MKILLSLGCVLLLSQCSMFSPGKKKGSESSGGQAEWALGAIDRKHSNGKVVIVDKRSATVTAYKNSKAEFSFPVLLGRARKDDFNKSVSAFSQGVTPAIYHRNPQIMYNPGFPGMYKEKAVIAYDDVTKVGGKTEVLSFHVTLGGSNDSNIGDGSSSNNRISNGCIRVRYSDYLKLVSFMSPSGNLNDLKAAQKEGKPKNISSPAAVVVLPEVDRSYSGTVKALR